MKYFITFSESDYSSWSITGLIGMTNVLCDADEKTLFFNEKEFAGDIAKKVLHMQNYIYIISLSDKGILKLEETIY